jgi:hypothetical protein
MALALVATLLHLQACSKGSAGGDAGADVRGTVTGLLPATEGMRQKGILGFVRIEGSGQHDTRYDKATVTITDTTRILWRDGKIERTIPLDSVPRGAEVEARFIGPVRESYPVQATASRLVVLKEHLSRK